MSATAAPQTLGSMRDKITERAGDALALMSFSVVPDLTSSFLSISGGNDGKNDVFMTQFAGGATISAELPLYLEGGLSYMRYDPTFVASGGQERSNVPTKWNTLAGSAGIGWDFAICEGLVFRPIFNIALGQVASDLSLGARYLDYRLDAYDLDFLDGGKMNAYGLGGSLMLDYELKRPEYEVDVEWRYSNIQLRTFGNTAPVVAGTTSAEATSAYARYRAPTGLSALERPLRYVLEFAHTTYLGDQRGLLGFNHLTSLGGGFELDSSAYDIFVTRTRLVARYAFGENVTGFAIGLAASF